MPMDLSAGPFKQDPIPPQVAERFKEIGNRHVEIIKGLKETYGDTKTPAELEQMAKDELNHEFIHEEAESH
ncbi:MAG: hypothetical protein JWM20_353 [Patescibacteria group bacterium]|nr:hypothetical protein [Patescibacteria group bacterium]